MSEFSRSCRPMLLILGLPPRSEDRLNPPRKADVRPLVMDSVIPCVKIFGHGVASSSRGRRKLAGSMLVFGSSGASTNLTRHETHVT